MSDSSDTSRLGGSPQSIPANYQSPDTIKSKQKEPLPKPVEISKDILSKLDTAKPGSNSAHLKTSHEITVKGPGIPSENNDQIHDQVHELGTNTLLPNKLSGNNQTSLIDSSYDEISSQSLTETEEIFESYTDEFEMDDMTEEERALLAALDEYEEIEQEKGEYRQEEANIAEQEAEKKDVISEAENQEAQGMQEKEHEALADSNETINEQQKLGVKTSNVTAMDVDAPFAAIVKGGYGLELNGTAKTIDFDKPEDAKWVQENPGRFFTVQKGVVEMPPELKKWVEEKNIPFKLPDGKPLGIPLDKIKVMSQERMAEVQKAVEHYVQKHAQSLAGPAVQETEVEEPKHETHESAQHKGDVRTELQARERAERKTREHAEKGVHRPVHDAEHTISEMMSPADFLKELLRESEKHHEQNYEKLMKFLEHEYILSEANKYSNSLKNIQETDTELTKATFDRLKDEVIHKLDGSKMNFDKIVNGILESEKQRQLNLLNADPSVKIKVRYEFLHKALSSVQAKYDRITNENLSIQERETYLKGYFDKVCIILIEAFKSTSTSTNTPQSGML